MIGRVLFSSLLRVGPALACLAFASLGPRPNATAESPTVGKTFSVEKRVPLTTSKVVGSPDPLPPYRVKRVYPDLQTGYPIHVVHQPGSNRLIVVSEASPYGPVKILRFKDDPSTREHETLWKLDGVAYDIKLHPDFQHNGYMFVGLNSPLSGKSPARKTRIIRYTMSRTPPYALDLKSARVIIEWHSDGHNGGALTFGHDGMLYITSGDGTSDSDTNIRGQDMTRLTAKVLRIDVDHPAEGKTYSVPKDNPFVGMKDVRPETWAYGLRNPWRMTTDAKTGHIWVGQNGQDLWEQAYLVQKGANYGWSIMEGNHPFYLNRKRGPTPLVPPTVEHPHSEFRSLTGGLVYYGKKYPELRGAYLYGDYSTGKIWGIRHDGRRALWHRELASTRLQITGFGTDTRGEILICDHHAADKGGGLYTLEPIPKDSAPSPFPRTLSASGLFRSVKGHVMEPALIPYSVNASLWSDGAYKERFIALPGASSKIDFTATRGWTCPDKAVLVKSFALEMEEGNPASRRWIETRFLTNQQGEWFGYSYIWNDEQTEGTLVEAKGLDRDFTVKVPKTAQSPAGIRKQTWHYPSRTECMVCHSRAANFVLGLSEVQMNKVHDYGKVADNQLRVLERLGVLRIKYMEGKHRKLVDPYDKKQDMALRARSYLHANCAQCHVEAGGGNAQMELEFSTPLEKMRLIDVKPVHHTYDLLDARLVAPGHPERSVLLKRMSHREAGHMPPLATSVVDREAVEVIRAWIEGMKKNQKDK
jgi:uncharacterized repeat protein (TIGR03806 family)